MKPVLKHYNDIISFGFSVSRLEDLGIELGVRLKRMSHIIKSGTVSLPDVVNSQQDKIYMMMIIYLS